MLESRGHKPVRFEMHNDDVAGMGKLALLGATVWHRAPAKQIRELIRQHKIDVVHFHNTFPLMSPAVYYAARAEGAAVVQTLHNFRLLCPGACFFRDGKVCEDCQGKSVALPGIKHKCYRGSTAASAAVVATVSIHRAMGTWSSAVDAYITPTPSAKSKFVAGGLPAEKITVKPHFLDPDPGMGGGGGDYAIFVGRLSHEKGIDTLLSAWKHLAGSVPLKIVGDGPLADDVKQAVASDASIQWLGRRTMDEVYDLIGRARVLIFPSNCYETFGRVAIEAYAKATPVIASNHGAMADVVADGRTGLRFTPGDGADLAAKVRQLLGDPAAHAAMRAEVRREFESKYTGTRNYEMLISIYEHARAARPNHRDASSAAPVTPVPVVR